MNTDNEDIGIFDLIAVLLKRKILIIGLTLCGMVCVLGFSIMSLLIPSEKSFFPNEYTPKALMLINDNSSSSGSLSSLLSSSGLGSLASLAGINVQSGSKYSALAVYLTKTNDFLDSIVDQFDLIKRYNLKTNPKTESRELLKRKMKAEYDNESGVFSISFTDRDPVFAQAVINYAVQKMEIRFTNMGLDKSKLSKDNLEVNLRNTYNEILRLEKESQKLMTSVNSGRSLNSGSSVVLEATRLELELRAQQSVYTQLRTQYELIKVQLASETPVFQVLEYAEVPDQKSGPSRGRLCVIVTLASFFFSIFLAYFLEGLNNLRNKQEIMSKLLSVSK